MGKYKTSGKFIVIHLFQAKNRVILQEKNLSLVVAKITFSFMKKV